MVKKKSVKKEVLDFIQIPGLEHMNAVELIKMDETTIEGEWKDVKEFPYMNFPFAKFNPAQSGMLEYVATDKNVVITSPTASGKTTMIEMFASYTFSLGKKAIYLSPLKSLSNEKLADWEQIEHAFSNKKIGILTGDFAKSTAQMSRLNESDMLILTSEMLDSCTRLAKESNVDYKWLFETGCLIIDEAHLIGEAGDRGHRLESAIIRFASQCPNARIILLSATMPNLDELVSWIQSLTNRETILYKSNYRPCSLEMHFIKFEAKGKDVAILEIINYIAKHHSDSSCLTFVGSKKFGTKIQQMFGSQGIVSEFYKADLSFEERTRLYNEFNSRKIQHLVATSALAWGVNTPARVVTAAHMTFGPFDIISTSTIRQMAGRAGRPQYDSKGIVYFLIPEKSWKRDYNRILNGEKLESQMKDSNIIAFHVLAEIMNKKIKCPVDLIQWFNKTLARHQTREMEIYEAKDVFDRLERCGMITELSDGTYVITQVGIACTNFYLIPEDLACWIRNFNKYFFEDRENAHSDKQDDWLIANALSTIPSWKNKLYVSADEKAVAEQEFDFFVGNAHQKIALGYWLCLNSDAFSEAMERNPKARFFYQIVEALRKDVERIISALNLIDVRTKKWNAGDFWSILQSRFKYGVGRDRLELCQLEGIGGARSRDLFNKGIRTVRDVIRNEFMVREILGDKVADKAITSARSMQASILEF
jgi:helicase